MMTAWMTALLPDDVSGAVAEDLASLVIAMSDGMSVGSQIYPDWQPDEYVELISSTIDGVATTRPDCRTHLARAPLGTRREREGLRERAEP